MRLILVRHGETSWNYQGRIQGCRSDTELSQKGRAQAEKIAIALRREKLGAVYSSTLRRARDTAQAIAQDCQLEVRLNHDLREIDAGEL
ncbi:histidine phosphatase family protein, partial [Chloroflexota bacterium]